MSVGDRDAALSGALVRFGPTSEVFAEADADNAGTSCTPEGFELALYGPLDHRPNVGFLAALPAGELARFAPDVFGAIGDMAETFGRDMFPSAGCDPGDWTSWLPFARPEVTP